MEIEIVPSPNIDASKCPTCANRRPWPQTISALRSKLQAHNVTWPHFEIRHGKNKTCKDAPESTGKWDKGLYVVAVDAAGREERHAKIFARKNPHFVGLKSILNGTASGRDGRSSG